MRRVKGPNGLVLSFPDAVAEALLRDADHVEVKGDEGKSEKKAPAKRAAAPKK